MLKFRLLLSIKGNIQPENNLVPKSLENLKRPEISSIKLEIPREHFMQRCAQ